MFKNLKKMMAHNSIQVIFLLDSQIKYLSMWLHCSEAVKLNRVMLFNQTLDKMSAQTRDVMHQELSRDRRKGAFLVQILAL